MTDTQFDEKIREILSEPQEQLPEGLWKGIESRLDEAAGRKRRVVILVRRWIAGASAVAAAVVAGVVIAHFVPADRVAGGEILAESAEEKTGVKYDTEKTGVKFDVVKAEGTSPVAMAAVTGSERKTEASESVMSMRTVDTERVGETETSEGNEAGGESTSENRISEVPLSETQTVEVQEIEDQETAGQRVDVDADGGEPECELKVDNSDIEAVYGKENSRDGSWKKTPFEISVGGNSFGGPQKNSTHKRMFVKGKKTPTGKTFVEGSNSDSYSLPISFGVGVKYSITKWLGVGVGVNYTLLNKKVTGTYYDEHEWSCSTNMKNSQHYIGIPLDIYFSVFRTKRWDIYAAVGGTVEKCILNRYTGIFEGESLLYTKKVSGIQTSVKAGFGVEFSPLDLLGIYIDPSLKYYFDNNQPRSIRTAQPLAFGIEAGLRFKL